jgi:hypothetical protein
MNRDLSAPLHSLDPLDWWAYADRLEESGAIPFLCERAGRIRDSLPREVNLTLVLRCEPVHLEKHWLRVGRTWFIPKEGTLLQNYPCARWFRPEWVRAGLDRYPYDSGFFGPRNVKKMIRFALGTPWSEPCKTNVLELYGPQTIGWFFWTHSQTELPEAWE